MPVISLTMELGCLSKEVAEALADELSARVVYAELVERTARHMGIPEHRLRRIVEGRARPRERWTVKTEDVRTFTRAELLALASKGGVIIRGWGAEELFRSIPNIPCVRICAPLAVRIANLKPLFDCDDGKFILRKIKTSDAALAARMHRNGRADSSNTYHLVLNTERCSVEHCADQILALVRQPYFARFEESHDKLRDLALVASIEAALEQDKKTRGIRLDMHSQNGVIRLAGIVNDMRERLALEELIGAHPGVVEVMSEVRLMSDQWRYRRIAPNF